MHEQGWDWLPMLLALVASEDHALAPGTYLQHRSVSFTATTCISLGGVHAAHLLQQH